MHARRGMGPFLSLGKRPGVDPHSLPPPKGQRPTLVNFPARRPVRDWNSQEAPDVRTSLMPWRYR